MILVSKLLLGLIQGILVKTAQYTIAYPNKHVEGIHNPTTTLWKLYITRFKKRGGGGK